MATGILALALLTVAAGQASSDLVSLNQQNFEIPIRIDPARRHEIKELLLFVSRDQGKTWEQVAVASPDKSAFPYYAPADGIYWFSVCVVDRQGQREPSDISKSPPGQKVLIDTVKPVLRIVTLERQGEEILVGWEVLDEHPDLSTLRMDFKAADPAVLSWTPVNVPPRDKMQYRFRCVERGPIVVRMQVQDLAGNTVETRAELAGTSPVASLSEANSYSPSAVPPVPGMLPPPPAPVPGSTPAETTTSVPAMPASRLQPETQSPIQPTALSQSGQRSVMDTRPWTAGAVNYHSGGLDGGPRQIAATSQTGGLPPVSSSAATGAQSPPAVGAAVDKLNSTEICIEYDVSKVGPSGLGKVELYVTADEGRTWQRAVDDPDLRSPITCTLPGEGLYGFWLVVTSKAGLGRRPPQDGDPPQMRVEVDLTPPEAKLYVPQADPRRRDCVLLSWDAHDRNLAPNPITLHYAIQPGGPWLPIAENLANVGRHSWPLPKDVPYQVYLKLTVRDSAGNVSEAVTPQPVVVDLTEPEVTLTRVSGAARQP